MRTHFWGVRGSISCCDAETTRYGGCTTSFSTTLNNGYTIIFDAGSGIRLLGDELLRQPHEPGQPRACTLCLSHAHWDHVLGLPFFMPLYDPSWEVTICGPAMSGDLSLENLMKRIFDPATFPVGWDHLSFSPRLIPVMPGDTLTRGDARLHVCAANHGKGTLAFRLEADGQSLFYSGDHEVGSDPVDLNTPFYQSMRGATVAIVDSQYTEADYVARHGWGHTAMEQWPPLAEALGVRQLVLTHYAPNYTDDMLDDIAEQLKQRFGALETRVTLAKQGTDITGDPPPPSPTLVFDPPLPYCPDCVFISELMQSTDMSFIFDTLLTQARHISMADAGTIFLVEDDRLVFSYAQNETLFNASQWARQQYLNASLPIDTSSIAGFVAIYQTTLNIADVRKLPPDVPYSFNESLDRASGYNTVSMCVVPLRGRDGNLVGVMQLINSKRGKDILPFTPYILLQVEKLCLLGAQTIARGLMVRDMILRMLQTAALRDPTETGSHVMRVGAMVAEIYHAWGKKREMNTADILKAKAQLRLAAMLHDVGKVGISDLILKKPGRLTPEERLEMQRHSALGGQLFSDARWDMDTLAREIALHHHQKWDGSGYTGDPDYPPLSGEDIPLGARLVAVADVFDALISPRSYKEPWPVEKAVAYIQEGAGSHFDPEVVDAFLEIQDTIEAIRSKYPG